MSFAETTQPQSGSRSNRYDRPWNDPVKAGESFTVPGIDNVPDLYGDINDPQSVVFMDGNQFMVVDELLTAFRKEHPQYDRIFVETLPPGILAGQIKTGSVSIGNMRISLRPDVYWRVSARWRKAANGSPTRISAAATN